MKLYNNLKHISQEDLIQEYEINKILKPHTKQQRDQFYIDYLRTTFGHPTRSKSKFEFGNSMQAFNELSHADDRFNRTDNDSKIELLECLARLSTQDRELMVLLYYGYTLTEIGNYYKVTSARISQRFKRLQERLHARVEEETGYKSEGQTCMEKILFNERQSLEYRAYKVMETNPQRRMEINFRKVIL